MLTIWSTKIKNKLALLLAERGVTVHPIEEDAGNVDRYVISERLAVERRTGSGFLRGIQDKTLFTSAIYLREHFAVPLLIVEGEINYEYTLFNPQAVRGALTSMLLEYGINVLSTPGVEETAALLAMLARQEQEGIPEISFVPKRKATELPDLQRRVVEMLPGCGRVTARELLQHFGSVERIVGAAPKALQAVRGIGKKKAAEIHRVLHAEYEAVDTEKNLEDAIEAEPALLFEHPITPVARQHMIDGEGGEQHIVDLVFFDARANALILVELKRGRLAPEHEAQLQRYLSRAARSPLLCEYLDRGASLRGILATMEPGGFEPQSPNITATVVDAAHVIEVLKSLRHQRL